MPVKSKATIFNPEYDQKPGMDDSKRVADSKTWKVTVEDLTAGVFHGLEYRSGPQVGNGYDGDALGEDRTKITYQGK